MTPPRLLNALDNVLELAPHQWVANCPNCDLAGQRGLIHIHAVDGHWRLDCDTCNHQSICNYLNLTPNQLRTDATRRHGIRAWHALTLAPTPEAWAELLAGKPLPKKALA